MNIKFDYNKNEDEIFDNYHCDDILYISVKLTMLRMLMMRLVLKKMLFLTAGLLFATHLFAADKTNDMDLSEFVKSNNDFSTLATALEASGLMDTLKGSGPFTLFAPNNAAFDKLPAGVLQSLLNSPDELREVLLYHVLSRKLISNNVSKETTTFESTENGEEMDISKDNGKLLINDHAKVIKPNIIVSNGVIHVIDTVLIPPSMQA